MGIARIDKSNVGVLLIDVQPAFVDLAFPAGGPGGEALMLRLEHLLMLAEMMDLPTVTTFETPTSENGELAERLESVFPAHGKRFVKSFFGCASEPDIASALKAAEVRQWAVAGAETDVCVLQSTLGLLETGYEVFLLEDCLFTTEPHPGPALRRMYQAGAVPTTLKTMAYELVLCADQIPWYPEFWAPNYQPQKPVPSGFVAPENWPSWEPS
jgi:nicotinamidase-related amidase